VFNNLEDGKACAKALIAQIKEFRNNTLASVKQDLMMRRSQRRKFRMGNMGKARFAVGLSAFLLRDTNARLTRQDYAELAGLPIERFLKLVKSQPSDFKIEPGSFENDRRRFNPRSGVLDGYKPGPPAKLLAYVFADFGVKKRLEDDSFAKDFIGTISEAAGSELGSPISANDQVFAPLKEMADELLNIPVAEMLGDWSKWLQESQGRILMTREKKERLGADSTFISNCTKVWETLAEWRQQIVKDVRRLNEYDGKFGSYLLHVLELDTEDPTEFFEAWDALIKMAIALSYMSPQLVKAFSPHTDFLRSAQSI
jgi:hypothetical protein